ncbi:tetratricopeptide repeat protein [Pararhodospirillum oryzae]|uniref:protein O-GlcNAc transferase n=1 Tax=Pararhodospirillum oryzae TaxID=478448 RepID=A0A512H3N4_9PROT|nr:tetratricopeptide repeat protein [Pararhodospirillum oryzae]GEO80076.1 hypothetical protein ROR02_02070 [Pararhodospirillum oryzae]
MPALREERLDRALAAHQAGRLDEALAEYDAILATDPAHVEALHLSAMALLMRGRPAVAVARVRLALVLAPDAMDPWRALAHACQARGDDAGAENAWRRLLAVRPGLSAPVLSLGRLLVRRGALAAAEALYRTLGSLIEAQHQLAAVLNERGAYEEALEVTGRCQVQEQTPSVSTLLNRGFALAGLERPGEAAELLRHALALDPGSWPVRANLARVLERSGAWAEALRVVEGAGDHPAAAVMATAVLPRVPVSGAEIDEARIRLRRGLAALRDRGAFLPDPNALGGALAVPALATHGRDDTALMTELAETMRRVSPVLGHVAAHAEKAPTGERRRVGVVSATLARGETAHGLVALVEELRGRPELEVVLVAPGPASSPAWARLVEEGTREAVLPRDILRAQKDLEALCLDVLVYPEVGVDPLTTALAHARLAPLQVALPGHPVTTGLPSIDAYVSADALEPPGARAHYREPLIRVPGLMTCQPRPQPEAADRARLALPEDATLYLCAHPLERIHPDMDAVFARVLAGDARGRLCLFRAPEGELTRLMGARLAAAGVPAERLVWLRWPRPGIRQAALKAVDVVLDAFYWGGGPAILEALGVGTPVVSWPGPFMRGRRTQGYYRMMGLNEGLARTQEGYERLALALGREPERRRALSEQLRDRAPGLFDDRRSILALADGIRSWTRPA